MCEFYPIHLDLLVIEENTKQAKVAPSRTTGGDWFSHDNNNSNHSNQQSPQEPPVQGKLLFIHRSKG